MTTPPRDGDSGDRPMDWSGPHTGEPLPDRPLPPPPPPPGAPGWQGPPTGGVPGPAAPRPFDVVAILAIVFAVIFGPLGFLLAIISLVRTRGGARRGRGVAIGALIVSILWIAAITAAVVAVVNAVAQRDDAGAIDHGGKLAVGSLRAGDCIQTFGTGASLTVDAVPCTEPHDSQVYAVFDLPDGAFPGLEGVTTAAEKGCTDRLAAATQGKVDGGELSVAYYHPQEASWDRGDREVTCVVVAEQGTLAEPVPTSA